MRKIVKITISDIEKATVVYKKNEKEGLYMSENGLFLAGKGLEKIIPLSDTQAYAYLERENQIDLIDEYFRIGLVKE